MTLGANFPSQYLRAHITRQLKSGAVIKLVRRMDDGKVHEKRFVVVHVDTHTITCIINSTVSTFLRQRPDMLRCQVAIDQTTHSFMDHDSHIDCSRVRTYSTADVIEDLLAKPDWLLGNITATLRDDMVAAIKFAPTLSPAEVTLLCESLGEIE